jgi:hypothetical protein
MKLFCAWKDCERHAEKGGYCLPHHKEFKAFGAGKQIIRQEPDEIDFSDAPDDWGTTRSINPDDGDRGNF